MGVERRQVRDTGRRHVAVVAGLAVLCVLVFLVSLRLGSYPTSWSEIQSVLLSGGGGVGYQIIWHIRLPRTITAMLVGLCLALSGACLQGVMRNPLASPGIIGISAGAGLSGVALLILFPDAHHLLTPVAFLGAFGTSLLIYLMAWRQGLQPARLILSGVAVSSFLGAGISALMVFYPDRVHNVLAFMVGGLSARAWKDVGTILPYAIAGSVLLGVLAKRLNLLMLGDEMAVSLGVPLERTRLFLLLLASLTAAAAVSVAGLLGFVGLLVPHMARIMVGSDHRLLFPASALLGAALLAACDTVARVVMDPVEIPVGIIMALLGAPFFLYLLHTGFKQHRK